VRTSANTPQAFTVLELLVCIADLAVLASLLMPALTRAKSNVKRAVCRNNLAQLGKGVAMYADDLKLGKRSGTTVFSSAPRNQRWISL
jgi:Tfp pilus assembly protein FimT